MAKKAFTQNDLTDAFCIVLGCKREVSEEAERLAEMGLIGLCRKALLAQGFRKFDGRFPVKQTEQVDDLSMNEYESRSAFEVIRTAMGAGTIVSAAFSDALEQTMLEFYDGATPNWQRWANASEVDRLVGTRNDFDPAQTPPAVPPGQVYPPHSESNKMSATVNLEKRGRVVKISFEAFLAGDMAEIQRLLREEAAALVRAEDDSLIDALTGTAGFFTSANTVTGAFTGDNLSEAMRKLRAMKSGTVKLHYRPAVLLIPAIYEQAAKKVCYESDLDLSVVVESRLDDASTVDWYLLADQKQSDSVVLQFLSGYRKPELRRLPRKLDFDGERYRVKHVCKGKATRSQGIIKGDG